MADMECGLEPHGSKVIVGMIAMRRCRESLDVERSVVVDTRHLSYVLFSLMIDT